jgi:hypothetical protein
MKKIKSFVEVLWVAKKKLASFLSELPTMNRSNHCGDLLTMGARKDSKRCFSGVASEETDQYPEMVC